MKRKLYNSLVKWKKSKNRKPLILHGARQVGKTWLLNEFAAKEYAKVVYFSLDRDNRARTVFEVGGTTEQLILSLSALSGITISAQDTLLILDEIQECPSALTALKFFYEDAPDIHIAVAGSLLGISVHENTSFPIGKVDILRLYPLDFEEFIRALGHDLLADQLVNGDRMIINSLKMEFENLLRQYYYVGGMPAVVQNFVTQKDFLQVRALQNQLLFEYEQDFSKHAPISELARIRMVWNSIPSQLAKENKKFVYGALRKGARASAFESVIQWLIDAGLVYRINAVSSVEMPLKFYEDHTAFKLFIFDVGILGAMVHAPADAVLIGNNIFSEYKGSFTEVFVASQLASGSIPTFYHTVKNSLIEMDFVVQLGQHAYPVEVKAETNVRSKSMKTFLQKHTNLTGIRLSMLPFISQDRLECMPLYAFRQAFERMAEIKMD